MQIKLSKAQWEAAGQKAGWLKEAQSNKLGGRGRLTFEGRKAIVATNEANRMGGYYHGLAAEAHHYALKCLNRDYISGQFSTPTIPTPYARNDKRYNVNLDMKKEYLAEADYHKKMIKFHLAEYEKLSNGERLARPLRME